MTAPSTATDQCPEMEGMERINRICDDFAVRLQKLRVRNHEEQPFYPNGSAKEVFRMDEEQLHELFELLSPSGTSKYGIVSAIVRHVVRNLSTIFAVVVRIRRAGDVNLLREFTDLIVHDDTLLQPPRLTDDELPIPLDKSQLFFSTFANEFFDTQFQFCAITLRRKEDVTYQDYRSQCPLPYKRQQRIGGGAFGEVYKVKIERHHVRSTGDRSGNLEPEWLARKDFKRQQSFTLELDVYKAIMKQPRKHDHLVMVVAILQYRDTSSLFFPLATGDLDQYLNGKLHGGERSLDTLDKKNLLFQRGLALAGALAFLHDGFDGVACLHLDLKPSNVLVYDAYEPEETWKITDFGLTRVRNREYSSAAPGFEGIYMPPECGTPDGRVTTQSDVWSLGCIFSLVITYMVHGSSGVKKFTEKRGERPEGDLFYITTRNSTPRISPAVTSWFDHLKQSSPRDEMLSRVVRESLDYLQSKVLHPICRQRATARDVELGLRAIHKHFEKRAPPPSPQPSQSQPEHVSVVDRFIARMKHRTPESSVSRLRSFGHNLDPNGFGFRFSPLDGDYLAFFSSQNTLFWTVSEIVSALRDGSQIPPPQALRIPDGTTKSFAVSSNTICNCLDADSFQCHLYNVAGTSSFVRVDDGVRVAYDHMGYIKRVAMSSDGSLAAFVVTDRPKGSEKDCRIYLAYTEHLMGTANEGNSYSVPRSSRSNSVSESSLMSVTTAANLIVEKIVVGSAAQIRFLGFTPNGKFLVLVIQDGSRGFSIRLWDTYSGKCWRDFSVEIESPEALRSLFTTCCLFMSKAGDPCLVVVSDHRRILHVNLSTRSTNDRKLNIGIDSVFVSDDGHTLVLIGKNHGLRAYLLPLHSLEKSDFIGSAKINRLSYAPALDDATIQRDPNKQLKLLIASSSGSFLEMGIDH